MEGFSTSYVYQLLPLIGFAFHNSKSTQRALPDTGTAAITKSFRNQMQFIVDDSERALDAGLYAFAAAITHRFINMDNFSLHFHRHFLAGKC